MVFTPGGRSSGGGRSDGLLLYTCIVVLEWLVGASFCGWALGRECGSAGLRLVDCGREAGGHAVCLVCGGVVGGQVNSPRVGERGEQKWLSVRPFVPWGECFVAEVRWDW